MLLHYFYFILFQKKLHTATKDLDKRNVTFLVGRATKEWWFVITRPLENYFIKHKFSPDTITLLGFVITSLSFVGYSFGWFVIGGWCVLLGGTMDMYDGRIAREFHVSSKKGEFFDSVMDRLGEAMMYLGLLNFYGNTLFFYIVFIALISAQMVSYSKARAESMGLTLTTGTMQRAERIVWIGVPSILSPAFAAISNYLFPISTTWLAAVGITVVAMMSGYTFYQRFDTVYKKLS